MREPPAISLDAMVGEIVRAVVEHVLRTELAPIRADLDALKRAAPVQWLDITAYCELHKCSPATARRWAVSGQVQTMRRGRVLRFAAGSIRPDETDIARMAAEARSR
jgi:hypothetical protein